MEAKTQLHVPAAFIPKKSDLLDRGMGGDHRLTGSERGRFTIRHYKNMLYLITKSLPK